MCGDLLHVESRGFQQTLSAPNPRPRDPLSWSHARLRPFVRSFRPMARMGTLEDVANAAEYLAGDLAGFIGGQHLLVSGGAPA